MELLLGLVSTGMPCLVQYASRSDHPLKDSTNSGCFRWDHDNTVMMPKIKIMFSPSNSITASSTPPCWPLSDATSPQLSRLPAGPPLAQRVPSYHASLLAPLWRDESPVILPLPRLRHCWCGSPATSIYSYRCCYYCCCSS